MIDALLPPQATTSDPPPGDDAPSRRAARGRRNRRHRRNRRDGDGDDDEAEEEREEVEDSLAEDVPEAEDFSALERELGLSLAGAADDPAVRARKAAARRDEEQIEARRASRA